MRKAFVLLIFLAAGTARATDRFYSDIAVTSPSGKYRVTAKSPDNKPGKKEHVAFQKNFVYICTDTQAKRTLWKREQPMEKPTESGYQFSKEGSPESIYVADDGWTVIKTEFNELILVDVQGVQHGVIKIFEHFSKREKEEYVADTSAGPMWESSSLWYYLNAEGGPYFVIRPWWGRHLVVELAAGKIVRAKDEVEKAVGKYERDLVMADLAKTADTYKIWEGECCPADAYRARTAAYLAGTMHIAEAVPLLRRLELSEYSGSSTMGQLGWDQEETKQHVGEVDPTSYNDLTVRQIVQTSLRQLGQTPRPLPGTELKRSYVRYRKDDEYKVPALKTPRADNAGRIEKGMKPEQVLGLIGAPDSISGGWEYDLDTQPARTLIVTWDGRRVKDVETKQPARWQDGLARNPKM